MLRRSFLAYAVGSVFAQSGDETVWRAWVAWFQDQSENLNIPQAIAKYRAHLEAHGASPSEIDRQIKVIQPRINGSEGARLFYNQRYTSQTPTYNEEPNAFLARMIENRKPGTALDFEMGQGRNAIFLAKNGWDVTGFDVAEEGVAVARRNAERAGVRLNAIVASADRFDWGEDRYHLVVSTYADEMTYATQIVRSLRLGGLLVIEDYLVDPKLRGAPKPPQAAGPNDLLKTFGSLRILYYEDFDGVADWGSRRKARVVRLAAEKQRNDRNP